MAGSFLESVPADADASLIKHVLHDWDDETVRRSLSNIREAMSLDSHLLIVEGSVEHHFSSCEKFRVWWEIAQMFGTVNKSRAGAQFTSSLQGMNV